MANDFWPNCRFDRFDIPARSPFSGRLDGRTVLFLHFLDHLIQNPTQEPGWVDPPLGTERAAQDLEGGLRVGINTLGYS